MNETQYEKISRPFRNNNRVKILLFANKLLTSIGYVSYPILLICTWFINKERILDVILIPAIGFVLLTFIRKAINRQRPYESLDIEPSIKKNKKGNSMPSRHVFSMAIIAISWFVISPLVACILIACAVLLACIRVIGGVHYISDVLVALICAFVWGLLYI